jgi:TPR repeat protein
MTTATRRTATSTVLAMLLCLGFSSGCAQRGYLTSATQKIEKKDYQGAVTDLELGAQNGDRRCAYVLGSIFISGEGVEPDLVEGVRWMREAAEAELPVAQAYLGTLYANGEGVENEPTTAVEWYRKAAEYGNPLGQAALGAAVFYGEGVPADHVEGYVWTKLAAEQGFPKAVSNLSEMSGALTDEERKQAEKRVARYHPKENQGPDSNFTTNNRGMRASSSARRAGNARSTRAGAIHGSGH